MYTVTALPPGTRKSPVFKAITAPLYEVQDEIRLAAGVKRKQQEARHEVLTNKVAELKQSTDTSETKLADLDSAVAELDAAIVTAVPKLIGDDVTPEYLGMTMAEQEGRFSLFSAEGGIFGTLSGRYSSGMPNLDLALKAWSGDHWDSGRVSRGDLSIANPHLTIGLTVQPETLEGLAETRQLRHSGFLGRFFYALPKSLVGARSIDTTPIPDDVRENYVAAVKSLANTAWPNEVVEVSLSEGAIKRLNDYREELEPHLHQEFGSLAEIADWAAKLPGQLVRVAALLALFDEPDIHTVDECWLEEAISLSPYFVAHAERAFGVMSGRYSRMNHAQAVLNWLRRKHIETFTVRGARRALGGQEWAKDVDAVRAAIAELADLGCVRPLEPPQRPASQSGRPPSPRHEVNPAIHRRQ